MANTPRDYDYEQRIDVKYNTDNESSGFTVSEMQNSSKVFVCSQNCVAGEFVIHLCRYKSSYYKIYM